MADLSQLKKHLRSVRMTGQLAGAMKTVSAAKYSRLGKVRQAHADYAEACAGLKVRFGAALGAAYPVKNPDAPPCYLLLGSNRGLCGGYNNELYSYAEELLRSCGREYRLLLTGKTAAEYFSERGVKADKKYILPDNIRHEDCAGLLRDITELYMNGEISSVTVIFQRFVNMLTHYPDRLELLPFSAEGGGAEDVLYMPDKAAVLRSAAALCLDEQLYSCILETGVGVQAATMMAMRSAYDNAEESAAELEAAISRKRQSEVTASVIETSGGNSFQ